jgi:hypothetical protein
MKKDPNAGSGCPDTPKTLLLARTSRNISELNGGSLERVVRMPNGCYLRPGGRMRMTLKQAFEIPESIVEELGLELDDAAASYDSEVVVWPWHPNGEAVSPGANEKPLK